jgi:hypothetical protein
VDEIVMLFQEDGVAKCLYNEEIELRDFGKLYTYRASSVEFNNNTFEWDVTLEDGTYLGSWESRNVAISKEVKYLQEQMKR